MAEIENSEVSLQLALLLKEITSDLLAIKRLSIQEKTFGTKLWLSVKEVSELLGGINVKKVLKMYKEGVFQGVEDGKSIKIFYESILVYMDKIKGPKFIHDNFFSNTQNILRKSEVSITELERYGFRK